MPSSQEHDTSARSLIILLLVIGGVAATSFFVLWARSDLFAAEAVWFAEGVRSIHPFLVGERMPVVFALLFWVVALGVVGMMWTYALVRHLPVGERGLLALAVGALVMPVHILVSAIVSMGSDGGMTQLQSLALHSLEHNTDTGYAASNLLFALVLGAMLVIARQIRLTRKKKQEGSVITSSSSYE